MKLEKSDLERLIIWRVAIKAWLQHPWIGWGPDNFIQAFRANRGWDYIDIYNNENILQGDAHNLILQYLVTTGLVGFSFLVYFIRKIDQFLTNNDDYTKCVRACFAGFIAVSMVEPLPFSVICIMSMLIGSCV